ncbi:uncharacterized protein LOC114536418 isoform X1 [Dendronephthya gigantea]|uniref:uncharacterized protein LOC114536418 isoform X1 n=2 Tax=Dendronephthya gigantea TaxID=151771 RepID=UPI001068EE39|nr:uncharacterized protein LOC114536418 isoform X1 [Dendronephthya gigantea]
MKHSLWNIRTVIFIILLPHVIALYEDLSEICLGERYTQYYKSLQPNISYVAVPFPFVTNETNVTLTCAGQAKVQIQDTARYIRVMFQKNNKMFHECRKEGVRISRISCSISVTGLTSNDTFTCIIKSGMAPCNAARLSFQVEGLSSLNASLTYATIRNDLRKIEVSCIGTGIPEPDVVWLLNGSMINHTSTQYDTKRKREIGQNAYRVNSTIIISGRKFPMSIRCVVQNGKYKVHSRTVYVLHVEVVGVEQTNAMVRWFGLSALGTRLMNVSVFTVTLKCGKEFNKTITIYNKSSVIFTDLTRGREYVIEVEAFTKRNDVILGAAKLFLPDKLPRPSHVYLAKITSKRAVVKWEKISANQKIHGVLLGYKLTLIGKTREIDFTLANHTNHVVLHDLTPRSNYTLSVRGFTQYDDGYIELFNFSSLDVIPAPKNVQIVILSKNSAGVQWTLIQQHKEKHDEIIGYRVIVRNAIHSFKVDTLSVTYSVALNHLLPEANYSVSVFGFGNGTKGISSKWIHFKINDREGPSGVSNKGGTNTDGRNFTLTIIVVLIVGVLF